MGLAKWLRERRAAKREDRAAIAREQAAERRAGDEPPSSLSETVEDTAGQFPQP